MGNRRLGRKRLYTIEKAGQTVDLAAGAGIEPAIIRTTQHRMGQELITEILVDLGTSKAAITTSGTGGNGDRSPIGVNGKLAKVTQLTTAKYGIITEIRAVLTEAITGGVKVGLEHGVNGDATVNTGSPAVDGGTRTQLIEDLDTVGEDTSVAINDNTAANKYFYIVQEANDTAATYDSGNIAIYIYGFAVPSDL